MSDTIKSMAKAAEYVGMGLRTFAYHQRKGHIRPAFYVGRASVFYVEDLDKFARMHKDSDGVTVADIAKQNGLTIAAAKSLIARMDLQNVGMRGNGRTFTKDDAALVGAHLNRRKQVRVDDGDSL